MKPRREFFHVTGVSDAFSNLWFIVALRVFRLFTIVVVLCIVSFVVVLFVHCLFEL